MTHEALVTTVWSAHGAVLLGVIAAFYKYGDRSETFSKSLQGTDSLLTKLRRRLSVELAAHLAPTIKSIQQKAVASPILGPDGESYSEKLPALADSEEFLESIQRFVESDVEVVVAYRSAQLAKRNWCLWSTVLSWSLCITLTWLLISTGLVLLLEKVFEVRIADVLLKCLLAVTCLTVLACLVPLPLQLWHHDAILGLRTKHDVP